MTADITLSNLQDRPEFFDTIADRMAHKRAAFD
jgi:hypothetical protein